MISFFLLLSFAPATCPHGDHLCQAERYIAMAGEAHQAGNHDLRLLRLYLAHREYLYLFDTTRSRDATRASEALCQARGVLTNALGLKPMPTHLADGFRKARQDTSKRERAANVNCAALRKTEQGQRVAIKPKAAPAPTEQGQRVAIKSKAAPAPTARGEDTPEARETTGVTATTTAEPSPGAVEVQAGPMPGGVAGTAETTTIAAKGAGGDDEPTEAPQPPGPASVPVASVNTVDTRRAAPIPSRVAPLRRGQPLFIAGVTMLGIGVAFGSVAAGTWADALATRREGESLVMTNQGMGDAATLARNAALKDQYEFKANLALGTTIAGAAALVTGFVMSGFGGHRMKKTGSTRALLPVPGGLVFRARF